MSTKTHLSEILNYIDGQWRSAEASEQLDVNNPATGQAIARIPLSPADQVDQAARAAARDFESWRRTPAAERVQFLFRIKQLLEDHFDELATLVTTECGKTLEESRGELRRGIENVEVACGIPAMMQGYNSEDIAAGIDEIMIRQPVGVVAAITPFNFPAMIPLWFTPYALACGNCMILKPSEKVPLSVQRILELISEAGLPAGVLQSVNGSKDVVDAILDHPLIRAVSFVGSTPVARYIYQRAAEKGKRAQCQAGAKNPLVVLPDADFESASRIVADSAFGCAGQRCLAGSIVVTVAGARGPFTEAIVEAARSRKVGCGLETGVEMGPVITTESQTRIEGWIQKGIEDGARPLVDGRGLKVAGYEGGYFVGPTILDEVKPTSPIAATEVFGPVLSMIQASSVDEAIELVNRGRYGNMACLFTSSGAAARKFRYEAQAGNIGINLGVAAPMAFFPFSGWGESFFGDLHGQGWDAIEFYTQKKVVIERWPKEWSRKF